MLHFEKGHKIKDKRKTLHSSVVTNEPGCDKVTAYTFTFLDIKHISLPFYSFSFECHFAFIYIYIYF